ncbi:hypothetical protein [Bradyrhizobium sp. JR3.5]
MGSRVSDGAGRRLVAFSAMALGVAVALIHSADPVLAADRRAPSSGGGVFVSEMSDVQRVRVTLNKSRTFRVETAVLVDRRGLARHRRREVAERPPDLRPG